VPGFSMDALLKNNEQDDVEERVKTYKPAKEIIGIVTNVKRDEVFAKAEDGKRVAAINKDIAKQEALQAEAKAHEEKARLEREALIHKQLAAKVEEDTKEIARLAQKMREQAANAKLKQIADSEKLTALNAKIAEAKKKAEEAKTEDAYAPVRRDVERFLFRVSNVSTGSFCEDTKALARLPLSAGDRERLRQAVLKLGTWYCEWCAMQFIPPVSGKKELKEMKARELANRRKEEAAAKAAEELARKERVAAKAVTKKKTKENK